MKPPRTPIEQTEFMRNLLAFLLVGAFISVLPVLTFKVIPPPNKDIITYMVGQLSGMALMALGFYFTNKVGQDALDAQKSENTAKLADAMKKTAEVAQAAQSGGGEEVTDQARADAADATADAAVDKAEEIKGK